MLMFFPNNYKKSVVLKLEAFVISSFFLFKQIWPNKDLTVGRITGRASTICPRRVGRRRIRVRRTTSRERHPKAGRDRPGITEQGAGGRSFWILLTSSVFIACLLLIL